MAAGRDSTPVQPCVSVGHSTLDRFYTMLLQGLAALTLRLTGLAVVLVALGYRLSKYGNAFGQAGLQVLLCYTWNYTWYR